MKLNDSDKLDLILSSLEETKAWRKKMEDRMEKAEHQLFLYKTLIYVLKWIGGLLVALITLRFGDVAKFFHS